MDPRHKRLLQGILLLALVTGVCAPLCNAQTKKVSLSPPKATVRSKKQFIVLAGTGIPLSKESLKQFWTLGPSGSLSFFVSVNPSTALGIGADVSLLYFRLGAFASTFPGVTAQRKDVVMAHVYVGVRHSFSPARGFSPYFVATVGAARVTAAEYREVIDSVRVTYYNIPGRTRLTGSLGLGTDISLARWLSFTMEAKATYFHNDEDVGFVFLVRGGFRFIF